MHGCVHWHESVVRALRQWKYIMGDSWKGCMDYSGVTNIGSCHYFNLAWRFRSSGSHCKLASSGYVCVSLCELHTHVPLSHAWKQTDTSGYVFICGNILLHQRLPAMPVSGCISSLSRLVDRRSKICDVGLHASLVALWSIITPTTYFAIFASQVGINYI